MPTEVKTYIQEKMTGTFGQYVSFDSNNNAELRNSPDSVILLVYAPSRSTVTITDGATTLPSVTLGNTQTSFSVNIPHSGEWYLRCTLSGNTTSTSILISSSGVYTVSLSFTTATINVTTAVGYTIKCTNNIITFTDNSQDGSATFTVTSLGEWDIIVTSGSTTTQKSVYVSQANQIINITIIPGEINPVLENNSWATIRAVVNSGNVPDTWAIGDSKEIVLNGSVGLKTFNNQIVKAVIIGKDHNGLETNGASNIHFMIELDDHLAFVDSDLIYNVPKNISSSYNNQKGFYNCTTKYDGDVAQSVNPSYSSSRINKYLLPELYNALPNELKEVLKPVKKWSAKRTIEKDETPVTAINYNQYYLFIPSLTEVIGTTSGFLSNYQTQYSYFETSSNRIKYKDTSTSTPCKWLVRDCLNVRWDISTTHTHPEGYGYLANISTTGTQETPTNYYNSQSDNNLQTTSLGFVPCFAIY